MQKRPAVHGLLAARLKAAKFQKREATVQQAVQSSGLSDADSEDEGNIEVSNKRMMARRRSFAAHAHHHRSCRVPAGLSAGRGGGCSIQQAAWGSVFEATATGQRPCAEGQGQAGRQWAPEWCSPTVGFTCMLWHNPSLSLQY